jgi:hypothetical protein
MGRYMHKLYPKHWVLSSKTRKRIWDGVFLPVPNYTETSGITQHKFLSITGDTEEKFNKNLLSKPDNWYYRHNEITYTLNSQGYRTKEFKEIKWEDSIVIFGCSHVMGAGLDDGDTISSNLERLIGLPVINMGVCGSSVDYNITNQTILRSYYPRPRAVVNLWPNIDRGTWFHQHTVEHLLPYSLKYNPNENNKLIFALNEDRYHQIVRGNIHRLIAEQLWKHDGLYYDATTNIIDAEALSCDFFYRDNNARDCSHFGKDCSVVIAGKIAKKLKL